MHACAQLHYSHACSFANAHMRAHVNEYVAVYVCLCVYIMYVCVGVVCENLYGRYHLSACLALL